jgi:hypothetical protein
MKLRRSTGVACSMVCAVVAVTMVLAATAVANPANKLALKRRFDTFLPAKLNDCATCHIKDGDHSAESLKEIPHNSFGARLRELKKTLNGEAGADGIAQRLEQVEREDSDGDGVDNLSELLLGYGPGDASDTPSAHAMETVESRRNAFRSFRKSAYPWRPFEKVRRPEPPVVADGEWGRNSIDAFLAKRHEARGLTARSAAGPEVLLRRVYLDLIGLSPSPGEVAAFVADPSDEAFDQTVDRLLAHPRYGERWGRHWMDVWRYSDWAGYKAAIRDSQRHIWRWRDWIVESLNENKGYDRMIVEMLAADEIAPLDENMLRATGFIARNWKASGREKWLTDLVDHTMQGFMGVTMGCAKCHDHKYDPIPQEEYYRLRAIFTPHGVRTDRLPGQPDTLKDGLPRVYERSPTSATYMLKRGDERFPIKDKKIEPGAPAAFGGRLDIRPIELPKFAYEPDKRPFVVAETKAASLAAVKKAEAALKTLKAGSKKATPEALELAESGLKAAKEQHASLIATLNVEAIEDAGKKDSGDWKRAAAEAFKLQREAALSDAAHKLKLAKSTEAKSLAAVEKAKAKSKGKATSATKKAGTALAAAKKKTEAAGKAMEKATAAMAKKSTLAYTPRKIAKYSSTSTGRRLAFARWLTNRDNPLTARVAMNHIWLRHFGVALVPTVSEFGANGASPTHPALLDWLAAEFMERGWNMKEMHKLIVTSAAYRMASTPDAHNREIDPDNVFLWRMNSRRMEAEVVRDNLLYICGALDSSMGGPDLPHTQGQSSHRSSIHLRQAHEKLVEFLQIFDGPNVVECYERKKTVQPHQALALANSELTYTHARRLADELTVDAPSSVDFIEVAFVRVLSRRPTDDELKVCAGFLSEQSEWLKAERSDSKIPPARRVRQNLVMTLFNHNDFVTVR